jgi:hypothetical protein
MEFPFTNFLYQPGELESTPSIKLLVFLPADSFPSAEEMAMLERMLKAMGLSRGTWRYLYHHGVFNPDLVIESDVEILFFMSNEQPFLQPERVEARDKSHFRLPSLAKIYSDPNIKRAVWELIKP